MSKKQKGFSLIELLIVVAIILIIAAIAIPNLIRARIAANQSSAAASLRTTGSASAMYLSTYQNGYPVSLAMIGPPAGAASCTAAGLIDAVLASGAKSGFAFTFTAGKTAVTTTSCGTPGNSDGFGAVADPVGTGGTVHYCIDTYMTIQQYNAAPAAPADDASGAMACAAGTPIGN